MVELPGGQERVWLGQWKGLPRHHLSLSVPSCPALPALKASDAPSLDSPRQQVALPGQPPPGPLVSKALSIQSSKRHPSLSCFQTCRGSLLPSGQRPLPAPRICFPHPLFSFCLLI